MIYPENIEEKLGFDVIRKRLADLCISDLGRTLVSELSFLIDITTIISLLDQIHDFSRLLKEGSLPETGNFSDVSSFLDKSSIQDNWLSGEALFSILTNITSANNLAEFLRNASTEYPSLKPLKPDISGLVTLEKKLLKSIDRDGTILDTASSALKTIRKNIISEEGSLRKKVNAIFKQAKSSGYIPDGASIAVRDGRMVIPVKAVSKRQVQGFIHDESATGNIVFLEPAIALDSNNKIRELQIAEAREIKRILLELTNEVSQHRDALERANSFLAGIDLLWAKAKLASILGANKPQLSDDKMELREIYHPILILTASDQKRKVVPHDIILTREERIMIISGPNAGGKSVALKSVGLNQMMVQMGLLPCANADSIFRIFANLFIDIGDEQSIENDLSTYSSHLQNMSTMLANAGQHSLALIDEFGSGTDPLFGGAIAEAVLRQLNKKHCYGVITTHFSNLKLLADNTDGLVNAAMRFDVEKLTPRYELEAGRPGSSFSLEVAAQSGLPGEVINEAKNEIGADHLAIEKLLTELEDEKKTLSESSIQLRRKEEELTILKKEYTILKQKLENRKADIINTAKTEASAILANTNKEIEKTIRHIKENRAEKKETQKARKTLKEYRTKIIPSNSKKPKEELKVIGGEIKKGDQALLVETGVVADVVEVKGKKARVLIGELQSVVPIEKIKKISKRQAKKVVYHKAKDNVAGTVSKKIANFSPILDVRGVRASNILPILQRFLDEALMLDQPKVKIIHGKGNGVLRQLIRQELKNWSQVKSFADEHVERGGDGATVLILK